MFQNAFFCEHFSGIISIRNSLSQRWFGDVKSVHNLLKMLNLKKYFTDELLQVALILSLLRIDRRALEYDVPAIGIGTNNLTNTWDQSSILVRREANVHPKSIDSVLLNYEQEVFHELNSLGRYNIFGSLISRNLTAYLLNVDEQQATVETNEEASSSVSTTNSEPPGDLDPHHKHKKTVDDDQLSQEVNLISYS